MKIRIACLVLLLNLVALATPMAHADTAGPKAPINANLKQILSLIPIPGIKGAMNGLVDGLKKGENGGYAAKAAVNGVPLQLYFFGSGMSQAALLVVDHEIDVPPVFNNRAWKRLEGAKLSGTIFSFSTTDFALDVSQMPADFKKVVAKNYFNVSSLNFSSGAQVAARIELGGDMKKVVEQDLHFPVHDFTLRAGVVVPVPTDAGSSASLVASMLADMKNVVKTLKDQPDFFVEFQPAPGTRIPAPLGMSQLILTDATISLTGHLVLGFRGNMIVPSGKKFITFFNTPLTPAGVMDFGDFEFGMAAQTATLRELAELSMCLNPASPKVPGGSFIKGIGKYRDQLNALLQPLSVFEISNPNQVGEYEFGNKNKPFPPKSAFNMLLLGPLASSTDSNGQTLSGPYLQAIGNVSVLKQKMGSFRLTVGDTGLQGVASAGLNFKMGPLGRQNISMRANADIEQNKQLMLVHGDVMGRKLDVSMDANSLSIDSPATCATPFELEEHLDLKSLANPDLSAMLDNLPGVNVDPSKLSGCVGEDLKKAYQWVAGTGSSLGGYTANQANQQLKNIADQEAAAAKAAQDAYNAAKDAAREKANQATNSAMNAFRDAGNAFRRLGGKKHRHHKGPDPRFAESVFDWNFYYDNAQDVVKAGVDLATHWRDNGFLEGRQGSFEFSARYYLNRYPDVQQKCGADLQCALQDWLDNGIAEGRQGSPGFSVADYLDRYPDLQSAFGRDNYADALDHWINHGREEGRDGSPASPSAGPVSAPVIAGGGRGSDWSDSDVCSGSFVSAIHMRSAKNIDGIEFGYAGRGWAPARGYQGGNPTADVYLGAGEYIVRVDYGGLNPINYLKFTSNLGKTYGPYGSGTPEGSYQVTPGEKLGCVSGREDKHIERLIFSSTGPR